MWDLPRSEEVGVPSSMAEDRLVLRSVFRVRAEKPCSRNFPGLSLSVSSTRGKVGQGGRQTRASCCPQPLGVACVLGSMPAALQSWPFQASLSPSTAYPQATVPGIIPSKHHLEARHRLHHLFSFKTAGAIRHYLYTETCMPYIMWTGQNQNTPLIFIHNT